MEPQNVQTFKKVSVLISTNITPKEMVRKFDIMEHSPLSKYTQLYEQVFNIDLYGYRVSFKNSEKMIKRVSEIEGYEKGMCKIELFVEYAGG